MRPTLLQPLASTSRQIITRSYAASPSTNPHLASPTDSRTEVIRRVLYPADAYSPNSASPTGAYHPDYVKRLNHLIPDQEVYETVERAWKLHQRTKRDQRQKVLSAKLKAMQEACEELDKLTTEGGGLARSVYDRAMSRPTLRGEKVEQGKKETPESRWAAARIEGLVPREMWVPVETRGKGWKYDWTRPGK